ncbi:MULTISPECIES: hypothetical protein [Mesorhizobium]|uniref:hypothetical protein n=1 Tax=Mesorhizobium TaxID=68287 RepID=UPI0008003172|nr:MULTISPECIES: hypothetical protein [Mesorhizobium]MUT27348.1 hypothetical protein [Mesorhizobium japonicum]OBQ82366.1 hypothetical protein A9K71_26360 [Mesorhizobium sp. WSM3873]
MGFVADVISRLSGQAAEDYTHRYIGPTGGTIAPEMEYVRVWLRSARILDVRRWTRKFYPTVHARFVHADATTGVREVMSVSSPTKAFQELDASHLDRFIVVNQPLLGPTPVRGDLTSEIALFSVVSDDLAKPYLDLLSELTANSAGSFLSSVAPIIAPLRRGAEVLLLDPGRAELEIGLSRTDSLIETGNIVVARTPKGGNALAEATIDKDDFRLLDRSGRPLGAFPYMVIGVERITERPDYRSIPEVRAAWKRITDAAQSLEPEDKVLDEFRALVRAVRFSADLVPHDRDRVITLFADELRQAGYEIGPVPGLPRSKAPLAVGGAESSAGLEGILPPQPPEEVEVADAIGPGRQISLAVAREMILDPRVPEEVVRQLLVPVPDQSRPFAPAVAFNPALVAVGQPDTGLEGAQLMGWANELVGWRRQNRFLMRRRENDPRPVLVSVGDSWFQFPLFLSDVIDQLGDTYSIWSLDAAGDTLENMVSHQQRHFQGLRRWKGVAKLLLFSGSGNDIVGEDPDGVSVLTKILRPFEPGKPAAWYLETGEFHRRLATLKGLYERLFKEVANEFPGLPVLCHGYDHAIPAFPQDKRNPLWARQDQWLTGPMVRRLGILDPTLRREIIANLIDRLNAMLIGLCGGNAGGTHKNAFHVDVRGVVRDRWADELHPTDRGFTDVTKRFADVVSQALGTGAEEAADVAVEAAREELLAFAAADRGEVPAPEAGAAGLEGTAAAGGLEGPFPEVSARALRLIVDYETGGRAYYERVLKKRPIWPKGQSGITIGFGYDLGYTTATEFARDWARLDDTVRQRLAPTVGLSSRTVPDADMAALAHDLRDIAIEWELAEAVFNAATMPKFVGKTVRVLPNARELHSHAFGALVSLTFNRGATYAVPRRLGDTLDRYREMRGIRQAMGAGRFRDVPPLMRMMKRVWRNTAVQAGLARRREDEALLFEAGLAEMLGQAGGSLSINYSQ